MVKIVGITQKDGEILLYYSYQRDSNIFFKAVSSKDGFAFDGKSRYIFVADEKKHAVEKVCWKSAVFVPQKKGYFVIYKPERKISLGLNTAFSDDLIHFTTQGKVTGVKGQFSVVPNMKFRNRYVMFFGEDEIRLAYSGDFKRWKPEKKVLVRRSGFFDDADLQVGGVFSQPDHILVIYYVNKRIGKTSRYVVGAATFNKKNPAEMLSRVDKPIWEFPQVIRSGKIAPLSCVLFKDELILYWLLGEDNIYAVSCPVPFKQGLKDKVFATLKRFENNPIIKPLVGNHWESRATFNTAAVYEDGRVHFVYRALGDRDVSVFGYASSRDGVHIDERLGEPIYVPREPFETPGHPSLASLIGHYLSTGGGYGGVEDPRITKVDDRFYMTYVAFDGAHPPRVALTSINVDDFLKRRWDRWERPKLISAPGIVNKNAIIFPEKVRGKYVVFHRVYPNILIDFVDDLKFNDYLKGEYIIAPREGYWDSKKIGAGPPPIKTKDGWLFIYQSVGRQDSGRYKIGAMILDCNNPAKVLYRCDTPLISPDMPYENEGHKAGVVYPCGAVVKDGTLYVYYGGADTVVCAASENLDTFLYQLKNAQTPRLRIVRSSFLN